MKILFVSSNRVGDAIMTTGLLDHLIHTHPDCRITIVCGPAATGVFARMPNLTRIIPFEKRRRDLHWLLLWRQVVGTAWDLVVDLRGSALAYMLCARARATRPRFARTRNYELQAAVLGLDPAPLPVAWTNGADDARAASLLPSGGPLIALGPTANWAPKAWPADRFAATFHAVAARCPGARPVVFGGPGDDERTLAAPLLAALPGAIDLVGAVTLPEAAACLARCALYVGNDSGLMHLAAAARVPTVGLFAATRARAAEMAPAGPWATACVAASDRMEDLSVEQALSAVARVLPP